ncbi:hypothetical protein H8356DRAFT_1310568 [Neocallimastix lanati (nom. inval.)]|jgi:hypothetical protein|uniref:Uncharacterized protein n=1 Tax=Neocallimastix californiae TaxID=1754190 RepID=A0A1Y2F0T2_9FUNG|nr:hypothetical protein H8356DRAFT_1310568 [Neocallimastix sp. JGI-2020a]ORY77450.1 hypothetical protein LY90DRAFT_665236 [Neocallimastix californiae]|eukprot:ORY77450.1 hypothetical protein LY90DRAFT_665236 [Neocallimastix californiae]
MLTPTELIELQSERKYFIENGAKASLFDWLRSKGTNFTCYVEYLNSLDNEQKLNNNIDIIRTVIYALHKPFQFTFFYWTLLIFILHKFNFKKPIMKIILVHFILRTLGDIINKFGDLFNHYYSNVPIFDANGKIVGNNCKYDSPSTEMHPFKWFLTRQIGCIFWCLGEIVADWYPLLRTKAVARDKSIKVVYITCGLFNFSKVLLILYHYTLSPTKLYDKNGAYDKAKVDLFYFTYWIIQLAIIYTSVIYDYSVYYIIKKSFSRINQMEHGFLKKFKSISEFRILVSAVVCVIFLPIVSVTIIIKYYYYYKYGYHNLEFSFDEIRQSINNVQYFMIFIDQILLISSSNKSTKISMLSSSNNYSSMKPSRSATKLNFSSIINNSNSTLIGNNILEYNSFSTIPRSPLSPTNLSSPSTPTTPTTPATLVNINTSFIYKNNGYSTPSKTHKVNNKLSKSNSYNEVKKNENNVNYEINNVNNNNEDNHNQNNNIINDNNISYNYSNSNDNISNIVSPNYGILSSFIDNKYQF